MSNCTNFDIACYDGLMLSSFAFFGLIILPICCVFRYYQIQQEEIQNKIILIPGYVHRDSSNINLSNIDLPPEYKDNKDNNDQII
jgi:hypothetical protein